MIEEAEIRKIYSLIPIPPNEKTENIEDKINTYNTAIKFPSIPREYNIIKIDKN